MGRVPTQPLPASVTDRAWAAASDAADPLAGFRERFVIADPGTVYLDGNSLGRLPRATGPRLASVVADEWGAGLIRSWSRWIELAGEVGDEIAAGIVDARPGEVLVGDSTTVNLYKLAAAALDARPDRRVLVVDDDNFPTDLYVFQGLAEARGLELRIVPTDIDAGPDPDRLRAALDEDVALLSLSHVAYRSGALADLAGITAAAHAVGSLTLWDLSHAAGSVEVPLAAAGADLAVGCTYKYLNGGPGAPAFLYVRQDLQASLRQPIWGWFGQSDQFAMGATYRPVESIDRFAVGTPPVLGLAAAQEGIRLTAEAGIGRIAAKGRALTSYAVQLADTWLTPLGFRLASPRDPDRRGAHVSLHHPDAWRICQALIDQHVIPDYRTPDRLRLGFSPLTTSFADVHEGFSRLHNLVAAGTHEGYSRDPSRVT
jgi:kynureninase